MEGGAKYPWVPPTLGTFPTLQKEPDVMLKPCTSPPQVLVRFTLAGIVAA